MAPPPTLLDAATAVLSAGPAHTLELAERVLGLRGNPPVASSAVFTLLGGDPRFQVDGKGVWHLADGAPGHSGPLERLRYAVVDVETTGGGRGGGHRMTEIAVVHIDGGVVGQSFQTLLNPGRRIPPRIQGMTGITDRMVAQAPYFEAVAAGVAERLEGRIFVAHNERFDWGFVSGELVEARGEAPEVERLCTVRLGRLLVPRLRSHRLDSLTAHYRIPIEGRHRAFGDALATARLLVQLLGEAADRGISDLPSLRRALGSRGTRARSARPELDPI